MFVGLITHLALSAGFGIAFALVAQRLHNMQTLVMAAAGFGVALYLVNFQILGRTVFEWFQEGPDRWFELAAHVGFALLLLTALGEDGQVSDLVEAPGGPLVPAGRPGSASFDDSTTFMITADRGANRLSFATMLICTNDGFTGANGLKLPKRVGESVTVSTNAYDAGTELNTEDFADIVPPCQGLIGVSSGEAGTGASNPALAEDGVIHHHAGIAGGSDLLPNVHGWTDPVARITVTAIG